MSDIRRNVLQQPGITLSFFLICLAVLVWPGFLGRIIPLDWKIGNMRPVAYGMQALFGLLAVICIFLRRRINTFWHRVFPDRKSLVFAIIGTLFAVLITLVMMEAALRILGKPYKVTWTPNEFYRVQFDPEIGWVYVPNKATVQQFVAGGPEVALYSSDIGSRIKGPGVQLDPAAPTTLFVGCSYTYGYGLPYEDTFVGQLASMGEFPYQTVNLGVEAYGTDQTLLLLKRYFNRFNTKVVVYTFLTNHVERNVNYDRRVLFPDGRFVGTKPLFGLRDDGSLYLKKKPLTYNQLVDFRLLDYVQSKWIRWGSKPSLDIGASFTTDEQVRQATDLTRALILEMKNFVESQGARFIVLFWNFGDPSERNFGLSILKGMEQNVIDISAYAPPDWGWKSYTILGDSHPNAKADAFAAQLLFEEFSRRGLITR